MMQALAARGHAVSLATIVPPTENALEGLKLATPTYCLAASRSQRSGAPRFADSASWLNRKFIDYFGVEEEWFSGLADVLRERTFDAVIVVARHLLPLLSVVKQAVRIWYPADDPAWHHFTRIKITERKTWSEAKSALINGLYERTFRSCFDRVWVVSSADRRAMRFMTGCRNVDLIPNGVDADYYQSGSSANIPTSCVFWGRLDFGPNVDALAWFLRKIWPTVRAEQPNATFHVFGFNPTAEVRELVRMPGVELHPDLPDLRSEVARRQVVVLPFISGGGIKNKLLEAAAMGMPIVGTRKALSGTRGKPAVCVAHGPRDWAAALGELWANPKARQDLGRAARRWVITHHTWDAAAQTAEEGIMKSLGRVR
jgi:glycosyltransferase involved in cell wall biosynthesis